MEGLLGFGLGLGGGRSPCRYGCWAFYKSAVGKRLEAHIAGAERIEGKAPNKRQRPHSSDPELGECG